MDWGVVIVALLGLVELVILLIAWAKSRHSMLECGHAKASLGMLQVHTSRMMCAVRAYENAISSIDIRKAEAARAVLFDAEEDARRVLDDMLERYHHIVRGTNYYKLADNVRLNMSGPVEDGLRMTLYLDRATGALSVRREQEFHDGRFRRVE